MKKIISVVLSVCMLLFAASCNLIVNNSDESQFDYPVTVGNVVFDKEPENVVVLSDNIADIILTCGYEGKLAARSDACTRDGLEVLPSVGTPDSPDIDKLRELNTTLVLGDQSFDSETKREIEELGAEVLIIKPAVNENEIKTLYSNIASILGGSYSGKIKAMPIAEGIENELDSMKNEIIDRDVISTACYIYSVGGDQFRVAYSKDYASQLFDYAQLTNIALDDDDGYIGIDTLIMSNPETIFCDEGVAEIIAEDSDLQNLSAVMNRKLFTLPRKYLTLQGRTRIQTVDYLIAKTHEFYTQKEVWPDDFDISEIEYTLPQEQEYIPPFEPKENIFYTVGETYSQIEPIEERLIQLGYLEGEADKTFTQETAEAVKRFQEVNGLEVSGKADYDTLVVLLSNYAIPAN